MKESNFVTNAGKGLLDIQPQFKGYEDAGPEPSLSELVHAYYTSEFSPEDANGFIKQYFERLFQQQTKEI